MKHHRFLDQVQQSAAANRGLFLPDGSRTQRNWPLCLTCLKDVEAAEAKDWNQESVEVWARCHGAEDFFRVVFPFRIEGDPMEDERANFALRRAMADACLFDPTKPSK